ncbi:MAG: hypothetical protein ACXWJK_11070 [Burkholderiaceae bacterium]
MKSTLTIKDLALDKQLDGKTMSAVRGGNSDQANATQQGNIAKMIAPVSVGNDSKIYGPTNFQVDSNPTQTLSNYSMSSNDKGLGLYEVYAD